MAPSLLSQILPGINHKMDSRKRRDLPPSSSQTAIIPTVSKSSQIKNPNLGFQDTREPNGKKPGMLGDRDEDDDSIEYSTPAQRRASLRARRPNLSLKAQENISLDYKRPTSGKNKIQTKPTRNAISDLLGVESDDELSFSPVLSRRAAIRRDIENHTKAFRDAFLIEKRDYWLPLLPENNYIQKLVVKHDMLPVEETAKLPAVSPYEEIEVQPRGITATMKPYQLSGLSFMMYLHRNGLSGILGDEMGLGKTLQTLSLIQYLKETDPRVATGRQQRPFLVICPLSVLSSWMSEARRWTPKLRVIRFHGPIQERTRLKKVVMGEVDHYGNLTHQARRKLKKRQGKTGQQSMIVETDSDDDESDGVDLVVTTYDCFKCEQSWFKTAFVWRYIVLDEGHTVKNHASLISKSLQGIKAEYRLILTGTPLQNNLSELWALLHWLYPEVFGANTKQLFDTSFNLSKGQFSGSVLDHARHLLELIMLRRMKSSPGVDLNLPPKEEVLLFIPLSPMQRFWYTRMITKADQGLLEELFKGVKNKEEDARKANKALEAREAEFAKIETEALKSLKDDALLGTDVWKETKAILQRTVQREQESGESPGGKKSDWAKLMNLVMQLRKVCNHPYQLLNAEPDPYEIGDHVITASGKFIVLEKLLNELVIKQRKKILIFSGFTKMLDLVEELLLLRGGDGSTFRSMRIDGATCRARRNLGIRMFNDLSSDYRVMLISTRAGGLGINLATASDVILLDQDWNPQITLQAEARAHRIGQLNQVTIYKLVASGTIDEQMISRIQKKLYLSAKVTEAMEDIHTKFGTSNRKGLSTTEHEDMPQLKTQELMTLVRRGASAISRPEVDVNEMLSWDWETTVAKCKDQPADINVKKGNIPNAQVDEEAERRWLSEMERVESYVFDGKKLAKANKATTNKELAIEYFNKADRRVNKNVTVEVDGYAISKESLGCADWEAVPTMAGKDPSLAEPKRRKKAPIENQPHCQICFDGGDLQCCQSCPRAYHYGCLDGDARNKTKGLMKFFCPQHHCYDCTQNTQMAGGMLYRCRWCERAFCEDCLDFDKTTLIGNNLLEYEIVGFPEMEQAFYVQCGACSDNFIARPDDKALVDEIAANIHLEHERKFGRHSISDDGLTDGSTIDPSSVNTPIPMDDDDFEQDVLLPSKRKAIGSTPLSSVKRGKLRANITK